MSQGRRAVHWVLIASIPTFAATAILLLLGERFAWVAAVLTLPLAIYSIVIPAALSLRPEPPPSAPRPRRLRLLVAGLVALLGGVLPGLIWWGFATYGDLDADLGGVVILRQDEPVTVPAVMEKREAAGNLVFVPRLANTDGGTTGCVQLRDSLHITAVVDSRPLPTVVAESGERVSIPIEAGAREVKLVVVFTDPSNQGCAVTATFSPGRLER